MSHTIKIFFRLDWTKTKQTQAFLTAFSNSKAETNIIVSQKGGSGEQGSWTSHREVALKLAQWISPEFEVFCIKKLDELFQTGKAELKVATPDKAVFWLDLQTKQQEAITYLQESLSNTKQQLERAKPAIRFTEQVSSTKKAISVQDFSNLLPDTGRTRLFKWFKENGY